MYLLCQPPISPPPPPPRSQFVFQSLTTLFPVLKRPYPSLFIVIFVCSIFLIFVFKKGFFFSHVCSLSLAPKTLGLSLSLCVSLCLSLSLSLFLSLSRRVPGRDIVTANRFCIPPNTYPNHHHHLTPILLFHHSPKTRTSTNTRELDVFRRSSVSHFYPQNYSLLISNALEIQPNFLTTARTPTAQKLKKDRPRVNF